MTKDIPTLELHHSLVYFWTLWNKKDWLTGYIA